MNNSPKPILKEQSQPQQERLFYLEFRLYFLGHVNRSDLQKRFGLKESSASRDIALYKKLAPQNVVYDYGLKSYIPKLSFEPLFSYTATQVLTALTHGFGDDYAGPKYPEIHSESPSQFPLPVVPILAGVTRAIHKSQAISIDYICNEQGRSKLDIVPHALIDSGTRWMVRAFDRSTSGFSNFVVNRIVSVLGDATDPEEGELSADDAAWNKIVGLNLKPHPTLAFPEAIMMEFGVQQGGALKMTCREALMSQLMDHWRIDAGEVPSADIGKYHLWLER